MQIVDGRITNTSTSEINCPYCNMSKLRWDIEFDSVTVKEEQVIDSSYTVKNVCAHCMTVVDEPPQMNFICAKCEQLTQYTQESSESEWKIFQRLFSYVKEEKFGEFYRQLTAEGLKIGKRYCMSCIYKIWRGFMANPSSLGLELEKPKPNYPLKQ